MADKYLLIQQIRDAFKDVTLDGGIGLTEAEGMDDYADELTLAECRKKDEKYQWESIPVQALNKNYCGISFFDAKGMRFHLPAFMIADINDEYIFELNFLVYISDLVRSQLELLSLQQRAAVRQYLEYCRDTDRYSADNIKEAIEGYWSAP